MLNFRSCTTCNEGFAPLVSQVQVVDPRGNTRQVTFNQNGYTSSDVRALGKAEQETTNYIYSSDNLISTITDQLGRVTKYSFDVFANPTWITGLSGTPNAVTTNLVYDTRFSNPLAVTDPLGNTTSINYDTYGSATSVSDPLGHQTTFGYNGMGLMTSATDASQNTTQFAYDFSDLIGVTDPMLNTTSMFHDGAGRLAQQTDSLGHTTKYQYNNLNQLTQVTDPLQGITTLSYDVNGNLLTVQDARQQGTNNKTVYTYDNFDHLHSRTDPLTRQETYVIDQLGNLTSFTDRRGKVTTYQYDGINRDTFIGYGTLPGPTYESTVNYTYDGGNRLHGSRRLHFWNHHSSFRRSRSADLRNYTAGQRRFSIRQRQQPENSDRNRPARRCYYYDNASRPYQSNAGKTPNTLIGYDNADRRNTLTLPNGIVLAYGYDNDSRVNSMTYQLGTT